MSLRLQLLAAFAYVLLLIIVALEVPLALNLARRIDAEVKNEAAAQAVVVAASASGRMKHPQQLAQVARQLLRMVHPARGAGRDDDCLRGGLVLHLGVDSPGQVEGQRHLERDDDQQ